MRIASIVVLLLGLVVSGDPFSRTANADASPEPTHQLRLATLAPRGSGLGKAFEELRKELREKTNGQVELKMYYGGVAGDEETVVRKMRVGQMDGALLTSTGLGALVPQVLVLQAPGLITSYPALDDVRKELASEFDTMFAKAGYKLVSWGDSGQIRIFSKHKIQHPDDLRGVRPWVWRGSPTMRAFIDAAGANGVTMGLPEVFSALQTGMVDTVPASALAAVSLQWYTRLKYISKRNSGIIVGATIMRKDKFEALTEDQQKVLADTGIRAHKALNRSVRRDDDKSYAAVLKRGVTEVDTSEHEAEWDEVSKKVRERLAGRVYPKSLLDAVIAAARKQE